MLEGRPDPVAAVAARGILRHVAADRALSDEESLQDALDESTP